MTRDVLRGPAIIQYGGESFYTETDINLDIELETEPQECSQYGQVDEMVLNRKVMITTKPLGLWGGSAVSFAARAALLWPRLTATNVGSAVFPHTAAAEKTITIWTIPDGKKYGFQSAAVFDMPSYIASGSKTACGDVSWLIVQKLAVSTNLVQPWSVDSSLVSVSTQSFNDTSFSTSDILRDNYSMYWGSVSGFGTSGSPLADTVNGFKIDFKEGKEPVTHDSFGVIDYTVKNLQVTMKVQLYGPTFEDVIASMKLQGTGSARGMSLNGINSSDVVIKGSAVGRPQITVYGAQIKVAPFGFGSAKPRVGELTFVATRTFTAGVANPLCSIGTVSA